MKWLDTLTEQSTRQMARRTSRRSLLASIGTMLVGASVLPLLPVMRGAAAAEGQSGAANAGINDPSSCDYWRHCAIDGFLCNCCGGTQRSCPPGTEPSPVTWIGTCRNPLDGKDYIISYNDCCGKHVCGVCYCHRNEGDKPVYFPHRSNDINWCFGTKSVVYNCSTAIVLGVATEEENAKS